MKTKMPIVLEMMEIVQTSVKEFNTGQRTTRFTKKICSLSGQYPWRDCQAKFKTYPDSLPKLPIYGGCMLKDVLMD
jgi:hypothetical protein